MLMGVMRNVKMHFMKKSVLILVVLICVSGMPGPLKAHPSDSIKKLPSAQWTRVRTVDILHIAMDLRFNWKSKQAYGTTDITFSPLRSSRKMALDAGRLTINSIKLSDGTALEYSYDGGDRDDGLEIVLDRVYHPNETITIRIDYRTNWTSPSDPNSLGGTNGKGLRFLGPTSTEPTRRQMIWTYGEAQNNRYWFPSFDAPQDLRTTDFTATVEKRFVVLSNGKMVGRTDHEDGTSSYHYRSEIPYANHLTSFVVGEFVDVKFDYQGIPLHSYSFPDEVAATKASVAQLPEMVEYFSEVTGLPYPYPGYSQAFVQDLPWGVGGNGLSTQTENMVDDDRTHADFLYLWDDLESETLAQQWFGNCIVPRDWSHAWLSKSFARYFSELYDEKKNGNDEFLLYPRSNWDRTNNYFPTWQSGYRRPIVTVHYEDPSTLLTDVYTSIHGADVLHMLRKHLGEEIWWKAVKLYVKENAFKLVTTDDFRKAVESVSGEPMDWFFDQWVYRMGHPVFDITKTYDSIQKKLTVMVKQIQQRDANDSYPQVEWFRGKVEIEIDNRIETVWLEPKEQNVFTFSSAHLPALVNFDYQDTWVKEIVFEKSPEELLFQFEYGKDMPGRQWAAGELVKRAKSDKASGEERQKIYAAYRRVMLSKCYWRFKWAVVISQLRTLLVPATSLTAPVGLDEATTAALLSVIQNDEAWVRASAIHFLGMTRDPKYTDVYLKALNDPSDRVINMAAIALGKTKSPKAFPALQKLVSKPSWKNQSLISALYALQQLEDPRGYPIANRALTDLTSPHWVLATPVWDYRIIAAQAIKTLGRSKESYPFLLNGFKRAMKEDDIHGVFYNTLLIVELAEPQGAEIFEPLKMKYKNDPNAMVAVDQYELRFKELTKRL
jgi:aminopeptidase N